MTDGDLWAAPLYWYLDSDRTAIVTNVPFVPVAWKMNTPETAFFPVTGAWMTPQAGEVTPPP